MFELHISCTKDFDSLNINFKDGTSFVQESSKDSKPKISGSEKKMTSVAKVHPENALIQKFETKSSVRNVENTPNIPKITEVRVDPDLNNFEI